MPNSPTPSLFICCLILCVPIGAQQTPTRDPQAIGVLQQSLAAMGGSVPTDSVAIGTIVVVAGSTTETGTIRILSRGVDQSAEQIHTTTGNRAVIYSRGFANEVQGTSVKRLQLELVVTSQCPDFPLALLAGALNRADSAFQYVGLETLNGAPAQRIRFWRTFSTNQRVKYLEGFSVKDLWVDAASGLPRKLSYIERSALGSRDALRVDVFYADYRSISGVFYPFLIRKSLNGTPWATIAIANVVFNAGLSDADFPVQ